MTQRPLSAPAPCAECGDVVRRVVDIQAQTELLIDADQVGADRGNVTVWKVGVSGLWIVEVHAQPGPPPPLEQWDRTPPPALFAVHVCPLLPASWATAATVTEVPA